MDTEVIILSDDEGIHSSRHGTTSTDTEGRGSDEQPRDPRLRRKARPAYRPPQGPHRERYYQAARTPGEPARPIPSLWMSIKSVFPWDVRQKKQAPEVNPMSFLEYCKAELRDFVRNQAGLVQNLTLVANAILDLGLRRPCADPFCESGAAEKPKLLPNSKGKIREIRTANANTQTETFAMDAPGDVLACLPCTAGGSEVTPTVPTLWSTGSSVFEMTRQKAIRQGRSHRRAAQKATEASRLYSRAMASTDPKLWNSCSVKVVALKATVGTNTENLTPKQQSAATDTSDLFSEDGSQPASDLVESSPESKKIPQSPESNQIHRSPRCFNCRQYGHRQKKCPMPRRKVCFQCGAQNQRDHHCRRSGNPY